MASGLVVCFSGRMASGKSSLSQILASTLGWSRAAFGDYVRTLVANRGGDPNSRQALQDLGQSLVDADPDQFCRDVLKSGHFDPGANFLLDGIRHVDIYNRVRTIVVPSRAILIHLSLDDAEAQKRLEGRNDKTDITLAEKHRVEAEIASSLPHVADRVVDASPAIQEVALQALSVISEFGVDPEVIEQARKKLASIADDGPRL
jgi:adenylate kinase family enzyme